jgi:TRAP-type C4-dicarboxylate transport system substrate-binding protein
MKKQKWTRIASVVIVIAMVIAMTACGDSGSSTSTGGGTTAGSGAGTGTDTAADLPDVELTLTLHDPATSRIGQALQAWSDDVSARTDGHLTITLFGSGSLAGGPDALDYVTNGSADIGWLYTMFYPGQFTLTEVVALPMLGINHPAQTAQILWDLYESTPELQNELDSKVKVLEMYGNPLNFISTTKKPIKSLADIKGMSLRCPAGAMSEVMKLWGANPMLVGAGDCYDALQKNNIEGTSWEWQGVEAFKLYEQLNYYMADMPIYEGVFVLGMNKDKFDSLPPEYQKVIEETTGRAGSVSFGETFYNAAEESKVAVLATGGEIVTLTPDAVAEFKAIADDYNANWAKTVTTGSFDGEAYLKKALDLLPKYAY